MFNFKVDHKKLFRKLFTGYIEVKNEWSDSLKKACFYFLSIFGVPKLKLFWVSEAELWMLFKSPIEATLSSKTNVWSFENGIFQFFCKVLSWNYFLGKWDKTYKIFKSKFGHRNLLIEWFWNFLELKNKYYGHLKTVLFRFLQIFDWRIWNHFVGRWGKVFKIA